MRTGADPVEQFRTARGIDADADWAARALVRLTFANVEGHTVDRVLADAAAQVRDSGSAPEELFGPADVWADEQVADLSQAGASFVDDDPDLGSTLCVSAGFAGVIALVFGVLLWFRHDDGVPFDAWLALVPPVMGLGIVVTAQGREQLLRWVSNTVAWAVYVGCVVVFAGLCAGLFWLGHGAPHRSPWLWFVEAAVLFGLAGLAWRLVPDEPTRVVRASGARAVDDQEWMTEARTALRNRGDLTEAQVDAHVAEAAAHARATGTTLAEEFGNPVGYARSLPGDDVVRWRRKTLGQAALLVLWLAIILTGGHSRFSYACLGALVVLVAVELVRSARKWQTARALRRGLLVPEGGHHA